MCKQCNAYEELKREHAALLRFHNGVRAERDELKRKYLVLLLEEKARATEKAGKEHEWSQCAEVCRVLQ